MAIRYWLNCTQCGAKDQEGYSWWDQYEDGPLTQAQLRTALIDAIKVEHDDACLDNFNGIDTEDYDEHGEYQEFDVNGRYHGKNRNKKVYSIDTSDGVMEVFYEYTLQARIDKRLVDEDDVVEVAIEEALPEMSVTMKIYWAYNWVNGGWALSEEDVSFS